MIVSSGANKVTNTNTAASSPIATASNQTIKIVQVGNQPRKTIAIMPNTTSKVQTSALTTTTTSNVSKISSTISASGHSSPSVISGTSLIPAMASAANTTLNAKDHCYYAKYNLKGADLRPDNNNNLKCFKNFVNNIRFRPLLPFGHFRLQPNS